MKNLINKWHTFSIMCAFLLLVGSCSSNKEMVSNKSEIAYQMQPSTQNGQDFNPNNAPPQGMPPGPPPGMNANGMSGPPPGGPGGKIDIKQFLAAVRVSSGTVLKRDTCITAKTANQSAVLSLSMSKAELQNCKIQTSGNTTSQESSSFQGLNAAVLGRDESEIKLSGDTIETSGEGANAIFAYGKSVIYTDKDVINCTGGGGHGIMCSGGGTIYASHVDITTAGRNSATVATDRGSGVITVDQGKMITKGADSPGLYSTGKLTVRNADIESTGSEMAVIEGSNQINLFNTTMRSTFPNKWGVMIYQSFSGDAEGADGEFAAENSSLTYTDATGPMFFVTNSTAYITLTNNEINTASGILLKAASSRWGQNGSNGGTGVIKAIHQKLNGNLNADTNSRIKLTLTEQSSLNGTVNAEKTAKYVSVAIDDSSVWSLTADAYVTEVKASIEGLTVKNIQGNHHTIYYDPDKNVDLGGKTYQLQGGGELKPV